MSEVTDKAKVAWLALTPRQRKAQAVRHYNGTCRCYGPRGDVVPQSRDTGKSCLIPNLPDPYWTEAQRMMPDKSGFTWKVR